ncbi:MAG TPA: hypothetical protein VJR89_14815 [Polyangiales bacterium]|nr:hypothetical protein [Polyangiales bacterium]
MSSEERGSALLLLLLVLCVPLVWLALGWRPQLLVGANDLSLLLVPAMRRLLAVSGDFDAFQYDPAWLGGSELRDILGELPLHHVLGAAGLDAVDLLNLTAFFAQVLYGHLAARGAYAVYGLARPDAERGSWLAQLLIGLCAAFTPLLAWRIGYGHLFIVFGALALPAACTLVLLVRAERLTTSCAAVILLAFAHALPHVGQQPVLYGAVFGLPLLAALIFGSASRRSRLQSIAVLALACAAALGCTLPALIGLWQQFAGSDLPRGLHAQPVTYTYLVATLRDQLGSLIWYLPRWTGRARFEWHETNYPIGPLLLALCFWPRAALGRRPLLGLAASFGLALAFAAHFKPISSLLLALVPPLGLFRVPARVALPLGLAVYPLLAGCLLVRAPRGWQRRDLGLVPVALALFLLSAGWRELAIWGVFLSLFLPALRVPSAPALLSLLALGSALSFSERLLPFPSRDALLTRPAELGAQLLAAAPELRSPLVRVATAPERRPNNTLYSIGVSGLSGYNLVNERMLRLYCALLGVPYQPGVSAISVDPGASYFPKLAALYDIVARLDLAQGRLEPLPRLGSPLWFSETLAPRASFEDLVRRLDARDLRRIAPFVSSDRAVHTLPQLQCHSEPHDIPYSTGTGPRILSAQLSGTRSGLCPLTIAMNYSADFEARGRLPSGAWQPLRSYPVYGALLGVLVPSEVRELELRMEPRRPLAGTLAQLLGLVLTAGMLAYPRRSGRRARNRIARD